MKHKSETEPPSLKERIEYHMLKTLALGLKGILSLDDAVKQKMHLHIYKALSLALRDIAMDRWIETNKRYREDDVKQLFYFSAEYLTGRFMGNNIINMGFRDEVNALLNDFQVDHNLIENQEMDAGLGNGGLGRLAACFMDSLAALELPGHGYGLRYDYGIFRQEICDGYQIEHPDQWLQHGNPWEIQHEEESVKVRFGGCIARDDVFEGKEKTSLEGCEEVVAIPFDTPVVGYDNGTVNTLRLWSTSVPDYEQFDIQAFDSGDYQSALKDVVSHDDLTMVSILYPNDNHDSGKRLRLKQQYILVSASLQDIVRAYKKNRKTGPGLFDDFHNKVAIQINDTHPSLVITELMRLLVDEESVAWADAWKITVATCAYTNHTVLSEALEQWDGHMMKEVLPRNYEIVELINHDFCIAIAEKYADDMDRVRRMSILENGKVRMANLAIVGSHSVNGVAALHTKILKEDFLRDFHEMYPTKFNNKTNGVTPRRWILKSNRPLTNLITDKIGDGWLKDLSQLKKLEQYAEDDSVLEQLMEIKAANKVRLKEYVYDRNVLKDAHGQEIGRMEIDSDSIYDVQAKRLHEYKRQLMNALHIQMLYNDLKDNPAKDFVPRTFLFAAKSAPGYHHAKAIIKFINILSRVINSDPEVSKKMKVIFLENYNVSMAEILLPAGDLSEQISTAGLEASGTGNMKLAMNGALTIGTMDGANVEMSEEIGEENMFIFGLRADEVKQLKETGYNPRDICDSNKGIQRVINQLWSDELTTNVKEREILRMLAESLVGQDRFLILKDLQSYKEAQERVSELYKDKKSWSKKMLLNIARMGKFSSDRTIAQYNEDIWNLEKVSLQ